MPVWPLSIWKARRTATAAPQPLDSAAALVVGASGAGYAQWPEDNYESAAREGYGRNELVFACVNEISTSAAEARLVVMRGQGKARAEVPNTRLAQLLARPNAGQSQFAFVELLHTYLQIAGNAYVFKLRGGGRQVLELHLLRPDRVTVWPGGDNAGGVRGYVYTLDGRDYVIAPEDVGHIRRPNPANDWYGLSPLHVLARAVNLDSNMTAFQKVFFDNAGVPSGFLKLKRRISSSQEADAVRAAWRSKFQGVRNWHQLAVLDEDTDYRQMGLDLDKMTMPDLRDVTEARICSVFGVPPILVGANVGLKRSTYSNYAEAKSSLWDETLKPEYRRVIDAFNLFLAPEFPGDGEVAADFSEVSALQDDEDKRSARVLAQWDKGLITRDEARAQLGYDPFKKGRGILVRLPTNVEEVDPEQEPEPPQPVPAPLAAAAAAAAQAQAQTLPVTPPADQQPPPNQGKALAGPGEGWSAPVSLKALTPREEHLLALLAANTEHHQPVVQAQTEAYFERLRSRVGGVMGRHLQWTPGDAVSKAPRDPEPGLPFDENDLVPPEADADIQRIMRALHVVIAQGAWDAVNAAGLLGDVPWNAGDPAVQRFLAEGSTRVVGINDTTRSALRAMLRRGVAAGYSMAQIANGVPADGYPGVRSLVTELYRNRAENIARTETGTAQLLAVAARYGASGVDRVRIMDGEDDEPCHSLNGTTQTVEWLRNNPLGHPRCTRAALPVIDIPTLQSRQQREDTTMPSIITKSAPAAGLIRKSARAEVKVIDAAQGLVDAYVNTMGVIDHDGDIIAPGAFLASIATGKLPAVCWMHGWQAIDGQVVDAQEVTAATPDGATVTRLLARMQFDMDDPESRGHFGKVAKGFIREWSVGFYAQADHLEMHDGRSVRVIDALDWVEVSPVLRGASPDTGTVAAKSVGETDAAVIISPQDSTGATNPEAAAPATSPDSGAAGTERARARLGLYATGLRLAGVPLTSEQAATGAGAADAKMGARNSAADMRRIQAMHDMSCELGASCPQPAAD